MAVPIQLLPDVPGTGTAQASQRTRFFYAVEAIAAGDCVSIDPTTTTYGLGYHIVKADTAVGEIPIGGALNAASAAGDLVEVVLAGVQTGVNVDSSGGPPPTIAIGDLLKPGGTAGRLIEWADASPILAPIATWPIAVCLSVPSGNTATVLWLGNRGIYGLSKAGG